MTMPRSRGFSLIELMIVVLIISILAAVALPSYRSYVLRSHRVDATRTLQDLAARQERYFFSNNKYATSLASLNGTSTMAGQFYTITDPISATTVAYTLEAKAIGTQLKDKCTQFSLNRAGVQASNSSTTADTLNCWGR